MTSDIDRTVIIGAGNVAWHLGHVLLKKGIEVVQVYNRSPEHGRSLAHSLKAEYIDTADKIVNDADLYVMAISDDAIGSLAGKLAVSECGMLVHTAGGVEMDVLSGINESYGVLYPLQTFTRERPVDFSRIPLLIEANSPKNLGKLKQLALLLSHRVYEVSSEDRLILHLAAVIASNFSNHMMACAGEILKDSKMPLEILEPLMLETIAKAFDVTPLKAQTGPAVRGNFKLIEKHMAMLGAYPEIKGIYQLISDNIIKLKN